MSLLYLTWFFQHFLKHLAQCFRSSPWLIWMDFNQPVT